MANMAKQYSGPNPALWTLTKELRRDYGNPARTYEFVTGYKSATNVSSHNADANGVAHAVDIFVGPGNLTEAQGIHVAEQLRLEGTRGTVPGHPDRLAYIIHRGRIAGDHTGWAWVGYTGPDWHGDHIHVSAVFDYYWGDPIPGNPADYNSTAAWNLGGTVAKPLGGDVTIIKPKEDTLSAAEVNQIKAAIAAEGKANREYMAALLLNSYTVGKDRFPGVRPVLVETQNRTSEVREIVRQLAEKGGVDIDYAKVEAAAAAGAARALSEAVDLDATVTLKATK